MTITYVSTRYTQPYIQPSIYEWPLMTLSKLVLFIPLNYRLTYVLKVDCDLVARVLVDFQFLSEGSCKRGQ